MQMQQYELICESEAKKWDVCPDIHPDDFIFRFLIDNPSFSSKEKAIERYFDNGFDSAKKLFHLLRNVCNYKDEQEIHLLEFASGYGRVTRHFQNVIPFLKVTSCDIHPEAIEFIQEKMGVNVALSASHPRQLSLNDEFDVIFALSFFSHIPKETFSEWLQALLSVTKPGGYLIFTTHGLESIKLIPDCKFDPEGFYFRADSEQKDLDTDSYGISCAAPIYVSTLINKISGCTIEFYNEAHWWNHQDVFVVRKAENEHSLAQLAVKVELTTLEKYWNQLVQTHYAQLTDTMKNEQEKRDFHNLKQLIKHVTPPAIFSIILKIYSAIRKRKTTN